MSIAENLEQVHACIDAAARRAGRDPASVRLVAVSKLHPPEAIREAHAAGQRLFGENYVQELSAKESQLDDLPAIEWHFIGHLQRNKARQITGRVGLVETVDSPKLLAEIAKRARSAGKVQHLLIQVRIGDEETKSGCEPRELPELLEVARSCSEVEVRGLMVIPPFELDADETRPYFRELRALRDRHGGPAVLPELSMGMSHDFEVAIEEGATLVRVGTAIFGERPSR